jgi:hypothetical protein
VLLCCDVMCCAVMADAGTWRLWPSTPSAPLATGTCCRGECFPTHSVPPYTAAACLATLPLPFMTVLHCTQGVLVAQLAV